MPLKKGQKAPNFKLPDEKGDLHELASYRGKYLLLYFYPKDDTPGCTKEACAIRDDYSKYKRLGIKVLGISIDSAKSHQKFKDKYDLPFTLLSDEDKKVVRRYDSWGKKKFMGKEYEGTLRNSFLIGKDGVIKKIYTNVIPEKHAEEVLADLKEIVGKTRKNTNKLK
jgi:thioredoxin-dependent peroxiredoxin